MSNSKRQLYGLTSVFVAGSGAAADTAIIADPGDGFAVVIDYLFYTVGGACTIMFESAGSTAVLPTETFAAAGKTVLPDMTLKLAASTSLTATTVGAGTGVWGVYAEYHLERA